MSRLGSRLPFCVCVPARNEVQRLPQLLLALTHQTIEGSIPVAVCLNNTTDNSKAAIDAAQRCHGRRLRIVVDRAIFPPDVAHVGSARARAMDMGLALLGDAGGILISTDADARPPAEWLDENLRAVAAGADLVGGRLTLDNAEALDVGMAKNFEQWARYWQQVRDIEDDIDPNADDPPPRHGDHTGASLAITTDMYRRSGGIPPLALGEDRALVEAALIAGARLRHPMSVWTRVSAREDGRAAGGMSTMVASMRRNLSANSAIMAPALSHWLKRALWRREMRTAFGTAYVIEAERNLPPMPHDAVLAAIGTAG